MIVFASSITDAARCTRNARRPGIRLAAEPDSEVLANAAAGSIFRSYNLILDSVAERDDLEALVLVHQDAEIVDPDFCRTLRAALTDPDVGVVGCVGAVGVRSIAWWEGSVDLGFVQPPLPGARRRRAAGALVEDGRAARRSPIPARSTPSTASCSRCRRGRSATSASTSRSAQLHGYDFDFCLQVRAAGRKVVTEDFRVVHHHSLELVSDPETWIAAHMRVAEKWAGRMPRRRRDGAGLAQRARRAEAEASLARTQAVAAHAAGRRARTRSSSASSTR